MPEYHKKWTAVEEVIPSLKSRYGEMVKASVEDFEDVVSLHSGKADGVVNTFHQEKRSFNNSRKIE